MKNVFARLIVFVMMTISPTIVPGVQARRRSVAGTGIKSTMLVSTAWLAEHIEGSRIWWCLAVGNKDGLSTRGTFPVRSLRITIDTHLMEGAERD